MRSTALAIVCVCALAINSFAAVASAMTLTQTDVNGLAFHSRATTATSGVYELQNAGTDVGGTVYTPSNPGFAGSVMWVAGQTVGSDTDIDTDLTNGVQTYAEYTVNFTSPGSYRVHWAGQRTAGVGVGEGGVAGNNDSIWIGPLNQNHTGTAGWVNLAIAAGGISYRSTSMLWVIDGSNVNTDLTFTVGLREDGPIFDRIAFVLEGSGVAPTTLEVVPEPSSFALAIAAVGLVAIRRFRRVGHAPWCA